MTISRKNIESLLKTEGLVTQGKWNFCNHNDGSEIYAETEQECKCEEDNNDCLFDCVCDDDMIKTESLGNFDIRWIEKRWGIDQGGLDAEFVCMIRNIFPKLARAYLALLDNESGDCGD